MKCESDWAWPKGGGRGEASDATLTHAQPINAALPSWPAPSGHMTASRVRGFTGSPTRLRLRGLAGWGDYRFPLQLFCLLLKGYSVTVSDSDSDICRRR
ncbi:hypothetical protein ACOMHN_027834 [Nucella lapillus]